MSKYRQQTNFSDFYDKAVIENHIDTQVRYEEGDDAIWKFFGFFRTDHPDHCCVDLPDEKNVRRCGRWAGYSSVGKAKAQLFDKDNDRKVTFKDVAGLSEAKQEGGRNRRIPQKSGKICELGGKNT